MRWRPRRVPEGLTFHVGVGAVSLFTGVLRNGRCCLTRTLVLGFGNVYRRDDGVAFVVLNALRQRLGLPVLAVDDY